MGGLFDGDDGGWGHINEASGDYARPETLVGHLLIVIPIGYVAHSLTRFSQPGKKSDAIVCDIIDLEDVDAQTGAPGKVYRSTWLRQGQLIASLRPQVGGRPVLGRMARGVPKNGMNPPWVIVDMATDAACVAAARSWAAANPGFVASTFREPDPVPAAPPAPAYQPPYPPQQGYAPPYGQPYSAAPPPGYAPPQPPAAPPAPPVYPPQQGGYPPPQVYPPQPPPQQAYPPAPGGYGPPAAPPQPPAAPGYPSQQYPPQAPPAYPPTPASAASPAYPPQQQGYQAGVTDVATLEAMRQARAQREQAGVVDTPPF